MDSIEQDNGETIVDMDVEGMPWHDRNAGLLGLGLLRHEKRRGGSPEAGAGASTGGNADATREFSKDEVRAYRHAAVKASLLVIAVFAAVFGAFIAFCDFVLFR